MTQSPRAHVIRGGLPGRLAVLALAAGIPLLAGCAAAGPSGTRPPVTGTSGRPSVSSASPVSSSASLAPGQRAQADAAARIVTLSMDYGGNAGGRKPPAPVTVTDPVTARRVAALVDNVPPLAPGSYSCPFADGRAVDLAFRAHPGGPALATAVLQLNGCEWVSLTIGKQDYSLGNPGGARQVAARVLQVAGVPWTLPPFQWPS